METKWRLAEELVRGTASLVEPAPSMRNDALPQHSSSLKPKRLGGPIIVARHRAEQHAANDRSVNLLSVLSWIAAPTDGGA